MEKNAALCSKKRALLELKARLLRIQKKSRLNHRLRGHLSNKSLQPPSIQAALPLKRLINSNQALMTKKKRRKRKRRRKRWKRRRRKRWKRKKRR